MAFLWLSLVALLAVSVSAQEYQTIDRTNTNLPKAYNSTKPNVLRFLGIGDWGRQYSLESVGLAGCSVSGFAGDNELQGAAQQRETAVLMDNVCGLVGGCRFVINTGDNFYECGVYPKDTTNRYVTDWENIYQRKQYTPNIHNLTWYHTFGNHDIVINGSVDAEIAFQSRSKNWVMPARNFYKDFSFAGVTIRIIFFDSTPFITKYNSLSSPYHEADYLAHHNKKYVSSVLGIVRHALKTSKADFNMIDTHFPFFGSSVSYGLADPTNSQYPGEFRAWARLGKILNKYKPAVYVNGHDHTMTVGKAQAPYDNGYTQFFTTGAGSWGETGDSCNSTEIVYSNGGNGGFILFSATKAVLRTDYFTLGSNYPQCTIDIPSDKSKPVKYSKNCQHGRANSCCSYSGSKADRACYRKK